MRWLPGLRPEPYWGGLQGSSRTPCWNKQ